MNILQQFFILIFPILFALTIHEFSHGYAAYMLGDDTAKRAGRLTLNPLKHLDPIGTIMLFIAKIGWAKPVPINPYNFKNMKKDTALVALAGPAANFISAILFSLIFNFLNPDLQITTINFYKFLIYSQVPNSFYLMFILILLFTIFINIALGLFNLIPFPPLDGSKILGAFLKDETYNKFQQFERKGMMIFLGIIIFSRLLNLNIIGKIIMPPIFFFLKILTGVS